MLNYRMSIEMTDSHVHFSLVDNLGTTLEFSPRQKSLLIFLRKRTNSHAIYAVLSATKRLFSLQKELNILKNTNSKRWKYFTP